VVTACSHIHRQWSHSGALIRLSAALSGKAAGAVAYRTSAPRALYAAAYRNARASACEKACSSSVGRERGRVG
jgi:hypothetical protein